jgi:primosomal protein N' (replication factor Y) (superfamily II helicase)
MSPPALYCDVSLPVPLDQSFTYALPETLRHRVRTGCRVLVPFGARKLTGVVLRIHDSRPPGAHDRPTSATREVLRLLDEEPALDDELLKLGRWISEYYCAPLGETLRAMTPLAGDVRRGKIYSLTKSGRDAARQLHLEQSDTDDSSVEILRLLDARPLSASYLMKKFARAVPVLRSLEKRGWVEVEDVAAERDPLRAGSARLRAEFIARPASRDTTRDTSRDQRERLHEDDPPATRDPSRDQAALAPGERLHADESPAPKLTKTERELLAYLELHPGSHNLVDLELAVAKASPAARSLARHNLVHLTQEPVVTAPIPTRPPVTLNPHQQDAYDQIRASGDAHQFKVFLLQGVTGSGKTEVYLRAIETAMAQGKGALMLVPEIALTPAVAGQFHHRFGRRVAILHSAFHDSERAQEWRRIRSGEASVVVATRSGVFAPVRNLGLIVVDEEHDQSYKQQETPRYHGRDVAVVRARAAGATVILGSATPSIESRYNADRGKYTRLLLPERIEQRPMARVDLIDMRQEFLETRKQATFSRALVDAVTERLENGEQTMLLLNRRGFSSFVACRACGARCECINCSVTLTYHRRDRRLLCHYCNYAARVPDRCPKCDSEYIQFVGTGSERLEDELHGAFPRARIARLDRDTVGAKRDYETILAAFRDGSFDILVGTQMIAKGHDIPNVTLVGIVSADIGLGLPDFRAAERTFQLLTQAAGRAGRGETPGIVLIQTINPDHYAVRCAAAQDYEAFYAKELEFRRMMSYPPFGVMANIIVRGARQEEASERSAALARLIGPAPEGVRVMGPAAAALARLKNEYRYQMLLKSASRKRLNVIVGELRRFAAAEKWGAAALVADIDPVTLL